MTKSVPRLVRQFVPDNYDVTLDINTKTMISSGSVVISGKKIGRPSQRITLHQNGLKIHTAELVRVDKTGKTAVTVSRIQVHKSAQEVRIHSEGVLYPGSYIVKLSFSAPISDAMNGIYPCYFKHQGEQKKLIATQFESHHAREAFPCIDEPEAKATFSLRLVTDTADTVIANTPILKTEELPNSRKQTEFALSPRMSTYLLAFAVGELVYRETTATSGLLIRSYATPDNVALTDFSLEVAAKAIDFFDTYFGTAFPLPKLDMLALPDFASGAMENWGLVTYRESAMLVDPASATIESKQLVALVICHELSHQWFGNLVTMAWWNDLWLNESFANLMEYRCVDALFPEWNIWEQFVSIESGSAKRRDYLEDVQPIQTAVNHPDEISTLFDPSIVYAKGGTILNMLRNFIGEPAFQLGLQQYFVEHAYANTVAADLWRAMSASSGQNVEAIMEQWLVTPGYPQLNVTWKPGDTTFSVSQKRFLLQPSDQATTETVWSVPLAGNCRLEPGILTSVSMASVRIEQSKDLPVVLNHDGHSYFIPKYTNHVHLLALAKAVREQVLSPIDRLLLLDNLLLLQRAAENDLTDVLDLLPSYRDEMNETVWGIIATAISEVRKLIEFKDEAESRLNTIVRHMVEGLVETLGWDDSPSDSPQTIRLRGLILSMAAAAKDKAVVAEGLSRFRTFQKPANIPSSIRATIYFITARFGSDSDFQRMLAAHDQTTNADERDELAAGLCTTANPAFHSLLLSRLNGPEIRRQDVLHWYVWLLRNRYARAAAWQWLQNEWSWIQDAFESDKSYSFFARYSGSIFSTDSEVASYREFFEPKQAIVALSRDIVLGIQEMAARLVWRARNETAVVEWLLQQAQVFDIVQ